MIKKIAVLGDGLQLVPPCGACRQTVVEYEHKQNHPIEVLFASMQGKVIKFASSADLLPFTFTLNLV